MVKFVLMNNWSAVKNILILVAGWMLFTACQKQEDAKDPILVFVPGEGLLSSNQIVSVGKSVRIKVYAEASGGISLRRMIIEKNAFQFVDTLFRDKLISFYLDITKTEEIQENWSFLVRDEEGGEAVEELILFRKASIAGLTSPAFGAQKSSIPGVYSTFENKSYTLPEAYQHQDSADMLFYFNPFTSVARLLAPSSRIADTVFTGTGGLAQWEIRNNTLFLPASNFNSGVFDTLSTDWFFAYPFSLAQSSWINQTGPLQTESLFYVKFSSGIYGLARVNSLIAGEAGQITLDLKIQEFNN